MSYLPSLKKLEYLVKLHELQHFGRTAEACFVSQSTLSAAITDLESKLGRVLIERDRHSMVFTLTGTELVRQAQEILSAANRFMETAEKSGLFFESTIRLGVIPTIAPFLMAPLLAGLEEEFPKLEVLIREDLTDNLLKLLLKGELDLLIMALPYVADSVETKDLYTESLQLIHRKNSKFISKGKNIDLPPGSILLLDEGNCLRDHTIGSCKMFRPKQIHSFAANSLNTVVLMVEYDVGVSYLPDMAIKSGILTNKNIALHKGRLNEGAERHIGLVWRKNSAFAKEFRLLGEHLKMAKNKLSGSR
ncbi:MAG: LysR family transcriptional regulator [Porticoccaceae bacterium]|nr:LysR family transcriptional regulator [Porticoccaceae bacterium]